MPRRVKPQPEAETSAFDQPMNGYQRVLPGWPGGRGPWQLTLIYQPVDGRYSLTSLEIKPSGKPTRLTTSVLRSLSLGQLFDEDAKLAEYLPPSQFRTAVVQATTESGRGRPPQYGRDHLVSVADIYRQAWALGAHPTKTVADRLHMSRSAAAKWVARAREAGLLAPTEKGRAGGNEHRRKK